MHYQKKVKAVIAVFLCTVLCIAAVSTPALHADAAGVSPGLNYVIDIILSKVGVHASQQYLEKFVEDVKTAWETERAGYETYCTENNLDPTDIQSQWQYRDECLTYNIHKYMISAVWAGTAGGVSLLKDLTNVAIVNSLLDTEDSTNISSGDEINIPDEAVEAVYEDFQNFVKEEGLGYYYVPVYKANEISVDIFTDRTSYDNFVLYVESSPNNTPVAAQFRGTTYNKAVRIYDNSLCPLYVGVPHNPNDYEYVKLYSYNDEWQFVSPYTWYYDGSGTIDINFTDSTSYSSYSSNANAQIDVRFSYSTDSYTTFNIMKFYAKERGRQIIFDSVSSMKSYSVGQRPVYYTTNNVYDNSVDNSIKVSGDYLINNGTYSYDTIYNNIQEGDIVNDNSINEVVNNTNSTIINNYYTESSGGDNSGGNSDDSGGGIGSLIGGIGDLLDFIVGVIGDLISVLTGFLDTIYNLLKSVGGTFTNFSGLLGELFVFIPKELIDLLTAGIGAGIAIALWKMFRR